MLKRRFLFTIAGMMLTLACAAPVAAQTFEEGYSLGPSARPFEDSEPFDSEYYEYDAQLWAPYDVTQMSGCPKFQNGFYAELGFVYWSMQTGDAVPSEDPQTFYTQDDMKWGRDLNVGYMSSKDEGWGLGWTSVGGMIFVSGEDIFIRNTMILDMSMDNVKINRQFRQRLSNGGWIEPYFGLNYFGFSDRTVWDDQGASGARFTQTVSNQGLGGHIGSAYYRDYGKFKVGGSAQVGMLYNDQSYHSTVFGGPFSINALQNTLGGSDVVPTLDLGLSLSYKFTRDLAIRGGFDLIYMWDGIVRANIQNPSVNPNAPTFSGRPFPQSLSPEDLVMAGFNFGVDWKR